MRVWVHYARLGEHLERREALDSEGACDALVFIDINSPKLQAWRKSATLAALQLLITLM